MINKRRKQYDRSYHLGHGGLLGLILEGMVAGKTPEEDHDCNTRAGL